MIFVIHISENELCLKISMEYVENFSERYIRNEIV